MVSDSVNGISGQIAGVNLSSFLQMIEMEKKTCTIKVLTRKDKGRIYFQNGNLIDSSTLTMNHLEALYDILTWTGIVIEVEKNELKREDVINLPLMHILLESARHADEMDKKRIPNDFDDAKLKSARNIPLQVLKNKDFCLEIGIKLLIDFDERAVSFRSILVGIEHGKYLLLKTPKPFEKMDHDRFKTQELIIKTLYKGTIYAFRSKLMTVISKPSKLMFIEYPGKIEHHELRSHKRFKCSIVAQTQVNERERSGVIENISKGGCRCTIEVFPTDAGFGSNLLNNTIPFRCYFPGSKEEISFIGEIKNTNKKSGEIAVGVKFVYPGTTEEVQDIINKYIRLIEYSSENV